MAAVTTVAVASLCNTSPPPPPLLLPASTPQSHTPASSYHFKPICSARKNYQLLTWRASSVSVSVSVSEWVSPSAGAAAVASKPHPPTQKQKQQRFACSRFPHICLVQAGCNKIFGGNNTSRHWRCDCRRSSANGDEFGKGFDIEEETEKVLEDEESRALLQGLAAATERVSAARRELDLIFEQEKHLAEFKVRLEHLNATQTEANELVANCERDFAAAELEVAAAELALVSARAGDSLQAFTNMAKTEAVDNNFERIESIRAAAISALGGVSASLPFAMASGQGLNLNFFLSEGSILVSCALFGVCFRYIVRGDIDNIQLKAGAAAAFGSVRGLGQLETTQLLVDCSKGGCHEVLKAALDAGQSFFIFFSAALVLDICLKKRLLKPFSAEKLQKQ